jgi:hypothetical protein
MVGTITARHLLMHWRLICREFGVRAYVRCVCRCLIPGDRTTFLACVTSRAR